MNNTRWFQALEDIRKGDVVVEDPPFSGKIRLARPEDVEETNSPAIPVN